MKPLKPAERLIVAADFAPVSPTDGRREVINKVLDLAKSLKGTGVYFKINSALRCSGYGLIGLIKSYDLKVFADLKLYDIPETLAIDGALLREEKPEILTVACAAGVEAMRALRAHLPKTEVLGVTVLTSLGDTDAHAMFSCSTLEAVLRFAAMAKKANLHGLISSGEEAKALREKFGIAMILNTPAIRPKWSIVPKDEQNPERIMTPIKAIRAGADRIVVGRPITQHENPYDAVMRTIDEIAAAGRPS